MFKDRIEWALNDHIEDLFTALQNDLGIKYGDVSPLDYMALEQAQNALAGIMNRILTEQAKANGARVFYDNDREIIVSIEELRRDYLEFIADGTLQKSEYPDFTYYLSACMDYNNGSLTEIE